MAYGRGHRNGPFEPFGGAGISICRVPCAISHFHAIAYRPVLLTLTIRDVAPATPRARVVRIDLDGHAFRFVAGQAVLVGNHGSGVRRPYSIANAPEDAARDRCLELLIGVRENGEAGDHLTLEAGTAVDVEGPAGTFTFPDAPAEPNIVFVAGGTGIAPLRAMVRHAVAEGQPRRRLGLLYSARTPDEFAFAAEFHGLAARGTIEFRQTITRDTTPDWSGGRGRIGPDALRQLVHGPDTLCFVCGPRTLVDDTPRVLRELGVAAERIRIEEW
jgi:NAD(P)H-flavin reductase